MHTEDTPETILLTRGNDGVARVTINRPQQRNALSLDALECLRKVFTGFQDDSELKCAILSGAGDRSFAAGGDLKELAAFRSADEAAHVSRVGRQALDAVRHCPVPVYAAINGHALGGGAELAMACDFRVASSSASIGFLQGKLNITTAWGGTADLLSLVGAGRSLELLLTSRVLNMVEAKDLGLIDQIVPDTGHLIDAVLKQAARFTSKPAHVVQAFTRIVHSGKAHLRSVIEPFEHESFVRTWIDDAHWTAAAQALTAGKPTSAKP